MLALVRFFKDYFRKKKAVYIPFNLFLNSLKGCKNNKPTLANWILKQEKVRLPRKL